MISQSVAVHTRLLVTFIVLQQRAFLLCESELQRHDSSKA